MRHQTEKQLTRERHYNWGWQDARRNREDGNQRRVPKFGRYPLPAHDPDYCWGYQAFWEAQP